MNYVAKKQAEEKPSCGKLFTTGAYEPIEQAAVQNLGCCMARISGILGVSIHADDFLAHRILQCLELEGLRELVGIDSAELRRVRR